MFRDKWIFHTMVALANNGEWHSAHLLKALGNINCTFRRTRCRNWKPVGTHFSESTPPKLQRLLVVGKSEAFAMSVRNKPWENSAAVVKCRRRSLQRNLSIRTTGYEEILRETFHFTMIMSISKNFRYFLHFVVAVSGFLGGKPPIVDAVLSFNQKEYVFNEKVSKEFECSKELEILRCCETNIFSVEIEIHQGLCLKNLHIHTQRNNSELNKGIKGSISDNELDEDTLVSLITHVDNILFQINPRLRSTSTISKK